MKTRGLRCRKFLAMTIFILALLTAFYFLYFKNNIHTVIPSQVYRSAQLSPQKLDDFIKRHHIRSIVNLRGAWEEDVFYRDEIRVSKQDHVKHYDLHLESLELPTLEQLRQLVLILQTAPRPLLIHCKNGADRTGLASAIVLTLQNKLSRDEIDKQYSWRYLVISSESVGKLIFDKYNIWLDKQHLLTSKENFMRWLASLTPRQFHVSAL